VLSSSEFSFNLRSAFNEDIILCKVENDDENLIAAMEGLLGLEEINFLNQQLWGDKQKAKQYALYQQTKFVADTSIVFRDKESLKRKQTRLIPFYYYISVAAGILLIVGFFFLNGNEHIQPEVAVIKNVIDNKVFKTMDSSLSIGSEIEKASVLPIATVSRFSKKKIKKNNLKLAASPKLSLVNLPDLAVPLENSIIEELVVNVDSTSLQPNKIEQLNNHPALVSGFEKKKETLKPIEFLSIPELAVEKIKERVLDKNTILSQKKCGRLKKINGWDIAQVVTTGISKLTGRDLELKPYYDDQGAVTAYALSAGEFQISKGR
jgi:hypothetical protein